MIPNMISLLRVFLMPLFLYLIFQPERSMKFAALMVFSFASLTDFLDGWSARKLKQESELGKFLDPLADKILVISTLVAFLLIDYLIPLWMIVVIIGRDVFVTLLRYVAVRKGMSIRTSRFGKIKTAFQMISILIIIMVFIVRGSSVTVPEEFMSEHYLKLMPAYKITVSDLDEKWLLAGPYWLMLMVTILTAWSGIRYLIFNWKVILPPYKKASK